MTISEIITKLETEQNHFDEDYNPSRGDDHVARVCSLSIELARHVSKLEQEVFKL